MSDTVICKLPPADPLSADDQLVVSQGFVSGKLRLDTLRNQIILPTPGPAGNVLTSNGTSWTSVTP